MLISISNACEQALSEEVGAKMIGDYSRRPEVIKSQASEVFLGYHTLAGLAFFPVPMIEGKRWLSVRM